MMCESETETTCIGQDAGALRTRLVQFRSSIGGGKLVAEWLRTRYVLVDQTMAKRDDEPGPRLSHLRGFLHTLSSFIVRYSSAGAFTTK